jgi:EmrB/QacA subfamily drug resistance transporter
MTIFENRAECRASGFWVLVVAIVGSSMAFIDSSAVNVALPSIGRDLHTDAQGLQWVIEGYSLFLSALILLGGSLGDIFGRRRVFLVGIAIFALASLVCAVAPSIAVLNAARCVQGIGGALATPGSLALISAGFSTAERGRAIGTWSGFAAITAAIGPLLGGWLAQHASWRYVFLINLPPAVFVIIAAVLRVAESRDERAGYSVDITGAALATAALGCLTFGLIRLQGTSLDFTGVSTTVAGLVLLIVFASWERRAAVPMIPLDVFRNATFLGANIYTFFLYAAIGGSLFFVPFDLQNVHHYSPTAAGASLLPFIVIMFVFSRWSGGLVAKIGARLPLVAGAIVAGLGFLAYARPGPGGSYWTTFFPAAVILGFGAALFVAPLTTAVMEAIDTSEAGIASGINNAVSRVAGLLAIAALGIVLLKTFYGDFDRGIARQALSSQARRSIEVDRAALSTGRGITSLGEPDRTQVNTAVAAAYTAAFRRTMIVSAGAAWIAALVALLMLPAGIRRAPGSTQAITSSPSDVVVERRH